MADRPRDRPTPATFLADVASHKMTVEVDSDRYRHVRFAEPGTGIMAFSLTTWPGRLAFSGDMGDFCFARLPDMFEFFRRPGSDVFAIDLGYWMEKVTAQDAKGGMERYSPEKFRKAVLWGLDGAPEEVLAVAREEARVTPSWAAFACSRKGAVDAAATHHKFRDAASLAAANVTAFRTISRLCDAAAGTDLAVVRDATVRVTMRATLFH